MGFFSKVTGLDDKAESYQRTMSYCLAALKERAVERGMELNSLLDKSCSANNQFQEVSLLFFLASAAVTDWDSEKNMMLVRGYEYSTLQKAVKEFMRDNGYIGLDLKYYQITRIENLENLEDENIVIAQALTQGLFGSDFIRGNNTNSISQNILDDFLDSLVSEQTYMDIYR